MLERIKHFLTGVLLENGEYPEFDELSLDDEIVYSDELDTMPDDMRPSDHM